MSKELIAKLRKSREFEVAVGTITFICRRPTDGDAVAWHRDGASFSDLTKRCVIGWSGVTENDITGNGVNDPADFSPELWAEWVVDRSDFWEPLATKILDAYQRHAAEVEERRKN